MYGFAGVHIRIPTKFVRRGAPSLLVRLSRQAATAQAKESGLVRGGAEELGVQRAR
jgi:hypothetical protein